MLETDIDSDPIPGTYLVPLTRGFYALIDAVDAERVGRKNWCVCRRDQCRYAMASDRINGRSRAVMMHRFLLGEIPAGREVDHINNNGLDNRRSNLRIVTHAENMRNRRDCRHVTDEPYITWEPKKSRFRVRIGRRNHGRYRTIEEAIQARNQALTGR